MEADVLKWLTNLLCLDTAQVAYSLNAVGKCEVRGQDLIEDISMGLVLADALKAIKELNRGVLGGQQQKDTSQKLDLLKKVRTAGARTYNWTILFDQLQNLLDMKTEKGRLAINHRDQRPRSS